jgi:hypothetical protein
MISNEIKTLWLKSDQVPELDRWQPRVTQVADFAQTADAWPTRRGRRHLRCHRGPDGNNGGHLEQRADQEGGWHGTLGLVLAEVQVRSRTAVPLFVRPKKF